MLYTPASRLCLLSATAALLEIGRAGAFLVQSSQRLSTRAPVQTGDISVPFRVHAQLSATKPLSIESIDAASQILADWDRLYSQQSISEGDTSNVVRSVVRPDDLGDAVLFLTKEAASQRAQDPAHGRLMLGICASSAAQGIAVLKSWVSALELPRGLLHGMDEAGTPLEINGGVYIKYNSGGVYTFADIRKSGLGFDALWKPGDAMLENYDGSYRGVYYQVELIDNDFRQYLCPLDLFDKISPNLT
jgi:hypothetical protein